MLVGVSMTDKAYVYIAGHELNTERDYLILQISPLEKGFSKNLCTTEMRFLSYFKQGLTFV